jgi:hypothetical protein
MPDAGPGLRRDDDALPKRRFTIEELVVGMTPDREQLMEDDWPMGEEII